MLLCFGSIVVFIIDLWVEKSSNATKLFDNWVAPFTDELKLPVIWFIVLIAVLGMIWKFYAEKKNEEIKNLENKMQNQIEMLILAHEKLGPYQLREILLEFFRSFVSTNPYVLGVQLYEYTQQHLHGKTKVRLNYIDGYAQELVDANAVHQSYYIFDISLYREFQRALERSFQQIKSVSETGGINSIGEELFDPVPLIEFVQKYNHRLSTKPIQSLNQDDAIEFAFVELGMRLLSVGVGEAIELYLEPNKVDKLKALKKRTGFLQAIMAQIPFTFQHDDSNDKADRQYIASPIHINDKQFVYMILLDPEIRNESEWLEKVDSLTDDFERKLVRCFSKRYTRDIRMKGECDHENTET